MIYLHDFEIMENYEIYEQLHMEMDFIIVEVEMLVKCEVEVVLLTILGIQ